MASTATFTAPSVASSSQRAAAPAQRRPGLFARLIEGLAAARHRQAEREIARLIQLQGGKMTDSVERQIERRFLNF